MGDETEGTEAVCDDARATGKGSYSAWLKKAKSENARFKMLQSSNTRYFTIDYEAQLLYYSHSATHKKISQPIPFRDILGAERLPKKGTKAQCGFVVKTRERNFELHATTAADAVHWTNGLNIASNMGNKGPSLQAAHDSIGNCVPAGFKHDDELTRPAEPAIEESNAAEGEVEAGHEEEGRRHAAEQQQQRDQAQASMATSLEEEERRLYDDAQALEAERIAKQEAERRLQELEAMFKAKEAEDAERKAREEAELQQLQQRELARQLQLQEEEARRKAQEQVDRQRYEEAVRKEEELERQKEEEARKARDFQLVRIAQEQAQRCEAEAAQKREVEEALHAEEEHQWPRKGTSFSDEMDQPRRKSADDCTAQEMFSVATELPSDFSHETELELLKADVRDLMAEGMELGFLEEALDFVFAMESLVGDEATDPKIAIDNWMKLMTDDAEQTNCFEDLGRNKSKKTDKKTEKTDEEREARRLRKEEKRKLREEQRAKEEQSVAEEDWRPTKANEESPGLPQKQGLPALQPLKPLKQLPKLRMTTPSETGSVASAPAPPQLSCRSTAAETAPTTAPSCSFEASAEPSGWDSDEEKVLQRRNTKTPEEKEVRNEIGISCLGLKSSNEMVQGKHETPSGWDSEDELAETAAPKILEGRAQTGEEPSGWDDSDDENIRQDLKAPEMDMATVDLKAC
eukprot:TRINITY_DN3349_c0_g1_i2.p1 TRINITY_DN3349_c0_g1~~TRINITY_DN3349_c0_g1_i2.p1  ORF type:complete len:690 (+),score=207.86 TRINITY_DN3349_c0_g1_i2:84-2153(+)